MEITPFTVAIADDDIEDLRRRLRNTRWPDAIDGMDWQDGADRAFLQRLTAHWQTGFDWRAQEARLNASPQFIAQVDDLRIHVIHRRGTGPTPYPLLLTHGFPGTGFDMEHLAALLADPGAHGGDPADAFDVVVPTLPGYGFSERPTKPGVGPERVADLWVQLMRGLGYERFGLHAGDWGAAVSIWLAARFPDDVVGLHLTFIPGMFAPPAGDGQPEPTAEEGAFLSALADWFDQEGAYHRLQSTKPQTPAFGLTDSPVGLAAWITEKMRNWSDCGGDVERVFSMDAILTNVSLFWFTATIASAMRFYRENKLRPNHFNVGDRVTPPLGIAQYPQEITPPRSWLERVFTVTHWTQMPRGGHFGAMEDPQRLAEDIRDFYRPLRHAGVGIEP